MINARSGWKLMTLTFGLEIYFHIFLIQANSNGFTLSFMFLVCKDMVHSVSVCHVASLGFGVQKRLDLIQPLSNYFGLFWFL